MAQAEELAAGLAELELQLSRTAGMTAAFDGELRRMQEGMVFTGREVNSLSSGIGIGLRRAFDGLVFDGAKLSDSLRHVGQAMVDSVYRVAMRPVQAAGGAAIASGLNALMSGIMPFANGAAFSAGRVTPFAEGGVVTSATAFPMRGGTGLMGEAGPEAIMPLARGPDGRLGVMAGGQGRGLSVVMNIATPDVASFQRSQSQIASQLGRALARGNRNG